MKRLIRASAEHPRLKDYASDIENQLKGFKQYNLDYENNILDIPMSPGITEQDLMADYGLGKWFQDLGFKVFFRNGDFEYTTKPEWINYRGMRRSKGHTSYLRNRLIMTVSGDGWYPQGITSSTSYKVEVDPDANDDDDQPTTWSVEMTDSEGTKHYIWIVKYDEKEYIVEDSNGNNLAKNLTYTTFAGAKKKAFQIAARQEDRDFFTD